MSRWGPYVRQRLDDLKYGKGREEWEGRWPSAVTVLSAWDWACQVFAEETPTPSVVPTEDGWVAFVWHKAGWSVELEVDPESHAEAWCWCREPDRTETLDLDVESDRQRFGELMAELAA